MDNIIIKDLEVYGFHGVLPEETKLGQKFLVSAKLYFDAYAIENDDLKYALDYAAVCHEIRNFFDSNIYRLIETAADELASYLFIKFAKIKKLKLEIKKPWAPIGLPLDFVSVKIERSPVSAFIGIGSNMGDRAGNIGDAVSAIKKIEGCTFTAESGIHETEPYGNTKQEKFLNCCVGIITVLTPFALLKSLNGIENNLGRVREAKWGPRTIDLDILLFGDYIIKTENLTVPHPDMHNRSFVLEPLSEIAPEAVHPVLGKKISELARGLDSFKL